MDKRCVVWPHAQAHLTNGFKEWQGFNVAHGATHFDNRDIDRIRCAQACAAFDEVLNFVGDVWNDLNRRSQIVTASFFFQHALVNLTSGEIVGAPHARVDEAFVMAQIEIGFSAVFGDKYLAVFERGHGARVDVDVRV